MDTQSVRSKLTKVVLDTISSHLLGVLIPADIHRLPYDSQGGKEGKKKKRTGTIRNAQIETIKRIIRQATDWEKLLTNHIHDKGHHKICYIFMRMISKKL